MQPEHVYILCGVIAAVSGATGFVAGRGNYPAKLVGAHEALASCEKEKELLHLDKLKWLAKLDQQEQELAKLPKRENGKFVKRGHQAKAKP